MSHFDKVSYQTKSAVLFVIFNRPDTTLRVFEQIRAAKPKRLYVAADAARADKPGEAQLCEETRAIVNSVDWECEVRTLFRDENLGCRDAVSSAITWFFNNEEEGIVIEDDCLVANSFFRFCDTLLKKYRNDTRIRHICGCNFQQGTKWGEASYYFSNRTHVWGWASWKRVWADYDKSLDKYDSNEVTKRLENIFNDPLVVNCWKNVFENVKAGNINSWAYPLDYINFFNNGLAIIPNENLVTNIGFGESATHTTDIENIYANIPLVEIGEITHPVFILPEKRADLVVLNQDFDIEQKKHKHNLLRKRIARWAKSSMQKAASLMMFLT